MIPECCICENQLVDPTDDELEENYNCSFCGLYVCDECRSDGESCCVARQDANEAE